MNRIFLIIFIISTSLEIFSQDRTRNIFPTELKEISLQNELLKDLTIYTYSKLNEDSGDELLMLMEVESREYIDDTPVKIEFHNSNAFDEIYYFEEEPFEWQLYLERFDGKYDLDVFIFSDNTDAKADTTYCYRINADSMNFDSAFHMNKLPNDSMIQSYSYMVENSGFDNWELQYTSVFKDTVNSNGDSAVVYFDLDGDSLNPRELTVIYEPNKNLYQEASYEIKSDNWLIQADSNLSSFVSRKREGKTLIRTELYAKIQWLKSSRPQWSAHVDKFYLDKDRIVRSEHKTLSVQNIFWLDGVWTFRMDEADEIKRYSYERQFEYDEMGRLSRRITEYGILTEITEFVYRDKLYVNPVMLILNEELDL